MEGVALLVEKQVAVQYGAGWNLESSCLSLVRGAKKEGVGRGEGEA